MSDGEQKSKSYLVTIKSFIANFKPQGHLKGTNLRSDLSRIHSCHDDFEQKISYIGQICLVSSVRRNAIGCLKLKGRVPCRGH